MSITRRNIIGLGAVVGVELVVGEGRAHAGEGTPKPGPPGQGLLSLAVTVWTGLPDNIKTDIWNDIKGAATAIGRAVGIVDAGPAPNGRVAKVTIKIRKHPAGHLVVHGQLENLDGSGPPHVTHDGTAPHHRHPDMLGHYNQIMRKSDTFLRSRKM